MTMLPIEQTESLRQYMLQHDIHCSEEFVINGEIQRFSGDNKNDNECWYVIHEIPDNNHIAFFGSWRMGTGTLKWYSWHGTKLPDDKLREYLKVVKTKQKEASQKLQEIHLDTAQKAQKSWDAASEEGNSPYLERKKVGAYGVRVESESILVQVRDLDGRLWSLQIILPEKNGDDRDKFFMTGGKIRGNCHTIGNLSNSEKAYICEGYATGASIFEAINAPVVIAFNATNIEAVVRAVKQKHPNLEVILAADNDCRKQKNTGFKMAKKVSEECGCQYTFPRFKDADGESTDFNDLHILEGLEEVKQQLESNTKFPISAVPHGFCLDRSALYIIKDKKDNDEEEEYIKFCTPLYVTAFTRDKDSQNWGKKLEWHDQDGQKHVWAMPMELLSGDVREVKSILLNQGFIFYYIARNAGEILQRYLMTASPKRRITCVDSIGWHDNHFVLPNRIIPYTAELVLQNHYDKYDIFRTKGTLKEWQDNVAVLCNNNPQLILALCAAFAAPLLHLLGINSFGLHFVGASSIGKTTALRVAASIYGAWQEYITTWRVTDNALESIAKSRNHCLLCLDELGQVDAFKAKDIAYMLANERGKGRQKSDGNNRKILSWKLIILSTGEITIGDKITEAGQKKTAGVEIRIVDIQTTGKYGIFDDLHECSGGQELSDLLRANTSKYYGTPIIEFLNYLTKNMAMIDKLKIITKAFCNQEELQNATGQIKRVAEYFGLLMGAGFCAVDAGVLPFDQTIIDNAINKCFAEWLANHGNIYKTHEQKQYLEVARDFLDRHQASRFTDEQDSSRIIHNFAGYKKDGNFYVTPGAFKEIYQGLNRKAVLRELREHNLLIYDTNENTKSARFSGQQSRRYYCIKEEILNMEAV